MMSKWKNTILANQTEKIQTFQQRDALDHECITINSGSIVNQFSFFLDPSYTTINGQLQIKVEFGISLYCTLYM